jgi:hypothetical protein
MDKNKILHQAKDVPADNPEGTMERFTEGLRRILIGPKPSHRKNGTRKDRRKHSVSPP